MSHGRYSRTCCRTLERSLNTYTHHHGPISERTRSQTRRHNRHNQTQSSRSHLITPSIGDFSQPTRATQATRLRASHILRTSRVSLRDRARRKPTQEQIEQLGDLDAAGAIQSIPRAQPARWKSDLDMLSQREQRRADASKLNEVEYNHTDAEMDEMFGILPGEEQDTPDLGAEMDVLKQYTLEGRVEDALWEGEESAGVWRYVRESVNVNGEGLSSVMRWAFAQGRAWERRIMDPECVEVVKKVLGLGRE